MEKGRTHSYFQERGQAECRIIDLSLRFRLLTRFKSLLSKQITHYFDPTLSLRLTAYRKNHSCETTLVRLTEDWKHATDRKELVTILSRRG